MNNTTAKSLLLDFRKHPQNILLTAREDLYSKDPPEFTEEYGKDKDGNEFHYRREKYYGTKIVVHIYNNTITNVELLE